MVALFDLLSRGYFPKELPPCFSTTGFAAIAASGSLPPAGSWKAKLARHSLARTGRIRRELGVPNPANYLGLSCEIAANWSRLTAYYARSPMSRSVPTVGGPDDLRSVVPSLGTSSIAEQRVIERTSAAYVLKADIAGYYGSIYTHSIPWALEGKAIAKANHSDTLLGNRLDRYARNAQDQQTLGLPIGPDASYILAELIGTALDLALIQRLGRTPAGFRFYDDFEISCSSSHDAERVRDALQETLRDYELQPNANKTRIEVMPGRLELAWVGRIRRFAFSQPATRSELLAFFDLAFALAHENPEQLVVPYAMRRLHSVHVPPVDHEVLLRLLVQAVLADASSIMDFLRAVTALAEETGWVIDRDLIAEAINLVIERSGNRGHGNEVAWALWGALAFEIDVLAPACRVLQSLDDPFVALLALDARRQKRLVALDVSRWKTRLVAGELFGEHWPLVYESLCHGFLRPTGGGDPVASDPFFLALRASGVRFYEPVQPATEVPEDYEDLTPDTVSR